MTETALDNEIQNQLQEKIAELELRVKGILGAIPAGVVFITTEGVVEATTPRFDQLLDLPPQEIVGKGLSQFISCSFSDVELARRLAEGVGQLIRAELLRREGGLTVFVSAEMIDTAEGVGLMLCILDATKEIPL